MNLRNKVKQGKRPEILRRVAPCILVGLIKSQAAVRKELELKEKRILPQDEAFRITHVKQKKNSEQPDEWVEERAKQSYIQFQQSRAELCSSLPPGTEPTDEQLN
ncbi:uncharacterized protein LOC132048072 isoform X2 [Lycium ferocissimum]|uniref:uncharacterized protein LOC132048072 isoform X2 n=1 Tax=Lycium ferocissimum TaxID=112874 RepID=UPI002814FEC0|nr:uncharacterized protein LOC132048072 isoform X2 [Lycium ferocissimum]